MGVLHKKDKLRKEYMQLENQLNDLYRKQRALPLVELKEPYQRGWVIYYELRDDIKRREDYPYLKRLVEFAFNKAYTRQIAHVKNVRGTQTVKEEIHPGRKHFKEKEIPEEFRKYFAKVLGIKHESYRLDYWKFEQYWLVRRVKPNIVTHARHDIYEPEIQRLQDILSNSFKYSRIIGRYKDMRFWNGASRAANRNEIRKFIHGEKDDIDPVPNKGIDCW